MVAGGVPQEAAGTTSGRTKKLKRRIGQAVVAAKKGYEMDDAEMPDAAGVMLRTRMLNEFLGTSYSMEQVEGMDPLTFEIVGAVRRAMFPDPGGG
jgi:hypothetical protein